MSTRLNYPDKVATDLKLQVPDENKFKASEINENKNAINDHADDIESLQSSHADSYIRRDTVLDEGDGRTFFPITGDPDVIYVATKMDIVTENGNYDWNGADYVYSQYQTISEKTSYVTEGSDVVVESGGVFDYLKIKNDNIFKKESFKRVSPLSNRVSESYDQYITDYYNFSNTTPPNIRDVSNGIYTFSSTLDFSLDTAAKTGFRFDALLFSSQDRDFVVCFKGEITATNAKTLKHTGSSDDVVLSDIVDSTPTAFEGVSNVVGLQGDGTKFTSLEVTQDDTNIDEVYFSIELSVFTVFDKVEGFELQDYINASDEGLIIPIFSNSDVAKKEYVDNSTEGLKTEIDLFHIDDVVLDTESGYYGVENNKVSSSSYERTVNPVDVQDFQGVRYSGEMGGNAPYGVLWLDRNGTLIKTDKLGGEASSRIVYSDFYIAKPDNAYFVNFSFYTSSSEPYYVKGNAYDIEEFSVKIKDVTTEIESGYYDNNGNKQSSSSWTRTKEYVYIENVLDIYSILTSLSGSNASIVFYDSAGDYLGFATQVSLGIPTGRGFLNLGDIAPVGTKYVNISSTSVSSVTPTITYPDRYLDIVKKEELEEVKNLVSSTNDDSYNLGKAFSQDSSVLDYANPKSKPSFVPLGSVSWWSYPNSLHLLSNDFAGIQNHTSQLFSWVHTKGDQFITEMFNNIGSSRRDIRHKCVSPKRIFEPDEHNVPAFMPLSNGKMIIVSSGHYDTEYLEIRIVDDLKTTGEVKKVPVNGECTYQQIAVSGNSVFVFTRDASYRWSYVFSLDNGETWSDCRTFLLGTSGHRAYMRIMRCEGDYMKVYWYPSASERASFVRYCEVNLVDGSVLDKKDGVSLGNIFDSGGLSIDLYTGGTQVFTNAGIIDPVTGLDKRIRLLDVSGNSRDEAVFVIATLEGDSSDVDMNGDYRVIEYDLTNSTSTEVILCEYGKEFYESGSDYMGGVYFEQSILGVRSGDLYISRYGTSATVYDPNDANNNFRVERWDNNSLVETIDDSSEQMYRAIPPQYFAPPTVSYRIKCVYHKGEYISFGRYYTNLYIHD